MLKKKVDALRIPTLREQPCPKLSKRTEDWAFRCAFSDVLVKLVRGLKVPIEVVQRFQVRSRNGTTVLAERMLEVWWDTHDLDAHRSL